MPKGSGQAEWLPRLRARQILRRIWESAAASVQGLTVSAANFDCSYTEPLFCPQFNEAPDVLAFESVNWVWNGNEGWTYSASLEHRKRCEFPTWDDAGEWTKLCALGLSAGCHNG